MTTLNKTTRARTSLVVLYYAAGICGHYHESTDCFEYPKKSLLKLSNPNKSWNQKFQTQKNLSIIPVT